MKSRLVKLVLERCLGHRKGEPVLVVADTETERTARAFAKSARKSGFDTKLVTMPPRKEPPPAVAEALKSRPVAVLITSRTLLSSTACIEASLDYGTRIAYLPGLDPKRLEALLDVDYRKIKTRCNALAKRFPGGRRVRLTSPGGTDLAFTIADCKPCISNGDLTKAGASGDLPAGEVRVTPLEGSAEGLLVVDGSIEDIGLLDTPVGIRFERGLAVEMADARLREALTEGGPGAFTLTELGIGANPRAALAGRPHEDEKAWGVVSLTLGAPPCAIVTVRGARLEIDGRALPDDLLQPAETPSPSAVKITAGETYRVLFENSNDPQIVLHLDSQRFIEANPSFERLCGYSREDMLSGRLTFADMVARESYPTYLKKRSSRRSMPTDRYDIRLKTKSGEKRSVELSVQLMSLQDRDVVLVSFRDLTPRKKMEREFWSKIEELGHANSRIFALTEKIRRVPELAPQLLNITHEVELLERTAHLLCAREGLAYADVSFYLLRDDALELVHSTSRVLRRRYLLSSNHPVVRVLRGETMDGTDHRVTLLPLKGRERNIGVIEVHFHPKELEVLAGNERTLKGYKDLLETLSSMLGLLVDNLHLYDAVRRQSIVDPLTGTFNRRYFDEKLTEETQRAARYGRPLSLLMIDIDRFSDVNNSLGHEQGDLVLRETARVFRESTRDVDSVCRYGGDEFSIIMPETDYQDALLKARRFCEQLRARTFPNVIEPTNPVKITLSIGVTALRPAARSGTDLLREADEAMYAAKNSGRDRVRGSLP